MTQQITAKDIIIHKRRLTTRKGENGRVLVIGGSREYTGSAILAGLAAFRSGVDWVTVAAPEKVAWAINAYTPDLVTYKVKEEYFGIQNVREMLELSKRFTIVLIGNGLSRKSWVFANRFMQQCACPMVIDADALHAVSIFDVTDSIFTPHQKEYEILLKNSGIPSKELQHHLLENVVLLKGHVDHIITKHAIYLSTKGNPGLAKAGTGDVLAGLCAGFYAQLGDPVQAAINASYYNKLAGNILLKRKQGYTYLASDLAQEVGRVIAYERRYHPNKRKK